MSQLIVIAFEGQHAAEQALLSIERMERDWELDLHEAIIVSRDNNGNTRLRHTQDLMAERTVGGGILGAFWGSVLGATLVNPAIAAGAAVGAIAGTVGTAMVQSANELDIEDAFRAKVARYLKPGSSAIGLIGWTNRPTKLLLELQGLKGTVIESSLSISDERELRRILSKDQAA